jgi:SsrA-binding protein
MTLIENKKARMRFTVLETIQAGIELDGGEVKSVRKRQGSLDGARVIVRGGEAYLVGMTIPPYQVANTSPAYNPERHRRLLLKKKEIVQISDAEDKKGLTVVPLELYNAGRYLKVRVAIVSGKNKADKREDLKLKDAKREMDRALKQKR